MLAIIITVIIKIRIIITTMIIIIIIVIRRTPGAGRVRSSVSKPLSFLVVSFLAC